MRSLALVGIVSSLALVPAVAAAAGAQSCNTADRSVLLVLDASGSMNARLPNRETRIAVARRAIKSVATLLPSEAQVSLRMYGAQSPKSGKNCQDTHRAVPFATAQVNGAAIASSVDAARAQGYTPIAFSLRQAAGDFPAGAKERVIVLVSDGKETCDGDPVVVAKELAGRGIVIHTVGFVVDSAARGQLQAVARATGGSYFDAPAGPELPDTLKRALYACKVETAIPSNPKPGKLRTTSATWLRSHPVINSETGQEAGKLDASHLEIALPAGIYEVRFGAASWKGIVVRPGETTTIEPGEIRLDPTADRTYAVDSETGERHGSFSVMSPAVTVMPGLYDIQIGKTVWPFIRVDGGKTVTLRPAQVKLADGVAFAKARVVTAAGAEVFRFDAVHKRVVLAPGNYIVEVDARKIPFNATGGAVLDVTAL
jgi:hypothetical protein